MRWMVIIIVWSVCLLPAKLLRAELAAVVGECVFQTEEPIQPGGSPVVAGKRADPCVDRTEVPVVSGKSHLEQAVAALPADGPVTATAVSPDGRQLATAGLRMIRIWDRQHGVLHHVWRGSSSWIRTLAFSPDGRLLAAAGDDGLIRLWDWEQNRTVARILDGGGGTVYTVAFKPDGTVLASGGADHVIRLWDVGRDAILQTLEGHQDVVRGVAFGPGGEMLVSGAQDGSVNLWRVGLAGGGVRPLRGARHGIYAVAFSPDGQWVVAGTLRTIYLWNTVTGHYKSPMTKHVSWVRSLAFSPDSSLLISAADDGLVQLWRMRDGARLETWVGHRAAVFAVNFVQGDEWISAGGDGRVLLWRQGNPDPLWTLIGGIDTQWLACRTLDDQCWRHDRESFLGPGGHVAAAQDVSMTSWVRNTLAFLTLLTLSVFAWVMVVRPLQQRWLVVLTTGRRLFRPFISLFDPFSPPRFARRLGGSLVFPIASYKSMAYIQMPKDFPLALTDFFYVQVTPGTMAIPSADMIRQMMQQTQRQGEQPPVWLLIASHLRRSASLPVLEPDGLWVVPDHGEQTRWLLAPHPGLALAHLLADHLHPFLLSPYQVSQAEPRAMLFFGRNPLLKKLLRQNGRNQLLLGGHGMGKTSLLYALGRVYHDHPIVRCALFAPTQETPLLYSKRPLLPTKTLEHPICLEDALDLLTQPFSLHRMMGPNRKKPVMLIDDADALILSEKLTNFTTLNRMRRLSEAGYCHFILAGSWAVQQLLRSEHAATLTDLVEIQYLEPLESVACWDLARKPMAWIQRDWEAGVGMALIQACGGRPDWIRAFCHEILRYLGPVAKTIRQEQLDALFASRQVGALLDQWPERLSPDTEEQRQDRLLVQGSVALEHFTMERILVLFQKKYPAFFTPDTQQTGGPSPAEQMQYALERLELAGLLRKVDGRYFYPSKLLRTRILHSQRKKGLRLLS